MQNILREFAWSKLCSIEIILNKIQEILFFSSKCNTLGTLILAKPNNFFESTSGLREWRH